MRLLNWIKRLMGWTEARLGETPWLRARPFW